ncbi:MAG: hypothetical protein RIQ41_114 [Candidatus Parcubacteria bacterium]|jgi:hypothetical protein
MNKENHFGFVGDPTRGITTRVACPAGTVPATKQEPARKPVWADEADQPADDPRAGPVDHLLPGGKVGHHSKR